jgi:hypothetical protein
MVALRVALERGASGCGSGSEDGRVIDDKISAR